MSFRPHIVAVLLGVAVSGCIFQSGRHGNGDASVNDGNTDTGVPDDSVNPTDGSNPPVDAAEDFGDDVGISPAIFPTFDYTEVSAYHGVLPLRPTFFGDQPDEEVDTTVARIRDHLRIVWSPTVELVDATEPVSDTTDFAIITTDTDLDASSQASSLGGTPWENPDVAMLVTSSSLMNDTYLLAGDVAREPNPQITVLSDVSPFAAGLDGTFHAYFTSEREIATRLTIPESAIREMRFIDLPEGGDEFDPREAWGILAFPDASILLEDVEANGRRIATGIDEAEGFNEFGYFVFDNMISWLVGESVRETAPCTLVTPASPSPIDFSIASRMRRNGCIVKVTGDANEATGVVVVSPRAPAVVGESLAGRSGPVVVLFTETGILQTMNIAGPGAADADAREWKRLGGTEDNFYAGQDALVFEVLTEPFMARFPERAGLAQAAQTFATPAENDTLASYIAVPRGPETPDGRRTGYRIALAMPAPFWRISTAGGLAIFDAAVQFAITAAELDNR